jgi:hypothetical protein
MLRRVRHINLCRGISSHEQQAVEYAVSTSEAPLCCLRAKNGRSERRCRHACALPANISVMVQWTTVRCGRCSLKRVHAWPELNAWELVHDISPSLQHEAISSYMLRSSPDSHSNQPTSCRTYHAIHVISTTSSVPGVVSLTTW